MSEFRLRPACDGDADFVFDAYKQAMRAYVESAWGWNEEFQRRGFRDNILLRGLQVIVVDAQGAGGLYVEEDAQSHTIRTVFLLPAFQGRGIGTRLVTQEMARARNAGKSLALKVIKGNPARRLYERLGFAVVREDDATFHMQLT